MFSFTELHGQSSQEKHGTIEWNSTYRTSRKPLWLVTLKLAVLAGMVGLGSAIVGPLLARWLPIWNAALATLGILLIYVGLAFFCRPRYNSDNMGWFGGMANDPFQYSDNVNRFLFQLHMLLGPGRFAAETLLDAGVYVGLVQGPEVIDEATAPASPGETLAASPLTHPATSDMGSLSTGLQSNRFDSAVGR